MIFAIISCNMSVDFVFLDSGTGGIPYLNFLKEKSPLSNCVYVADTKNFPYGEKSSGQIKECVISICEKIIRKFNPKVIVIACNTMSVNALDHVRKAFPDKIFVGTVPAIKLAAAISRKKRIGLLATNSTVQHPYNQKLKEDFASDCILISRGDAELISFVEHQSFTATEEECIAAIKPAVDFFKKEDCDVIILGCTHFLNIADLIQKVCGDQIKVVDSKEGVVKQALRAALEPAERVAEDRSSSAAKGWSQGEASPLSERIPSELYITGFSEKKDQKEYDVICKQFGLVFKDIL